MKSAAALWAVLLLCVIAAEARSRPRRDSSSREMGYFGGGNMGTYFYSFRDDFGSDWSPEMGGPMMHGVDTYHHMGNRGINSMAEITNTGLNPLRPLLPIPPINTFPHSILTAFRDKFHRVTTAVQNIPYAISTIASTVLNPQPAQPGFQPRPNHQDQGDRYPTPGAVIYPSTSSGSSATSNSRGSSNNQQSTGGSNRFPVVIINSQNQGNPQPFGQRPFSSSTNGTQGGPAIPVASGGAAPPNDYVSHDTPFILDQFPSWVNPNSHAPQGSSANTGNNPSQTNNNFVSSTNNGNAPFQSGNNFGRPIIADSASNGNTFGNSNNFPTTSQQGSVNVASSNNGRPTPNPNAFGGSTPVQRPSQGFSLVNGIQEFTLDILSTFRNQGTVGNIVYSPVSIASLLSLLTLATDGNTRHQIEVALHLPNSQSSDSQHRQFEDILRRLNHDSQGININTASRLFLEENILIYGSFTEKAKTHYNCSVSLENFRHRPAQTRDRVNAWVETETQGKITNFLDRPFARDTKFVAVNTIFFNGEWQTPFPAYFTTLRDFDTGSNVVRVQMMTNVFETYHYYSPDLNVDIVSIPYSGGEFAMFVILPRDSPQEKSITVVESELRAPIIQQLIGNMAKKSVSLSLPRMRMSMKSSLVSGLSQLNIKDIFDSNLANFSGLTNTRPIWVNQILHEAVMEVTEVGTVAAAASAATMDRIGGYQRVNVNKPAIIFIQDLVTGTPLFWTRMVEPEPIT